MSLEPFKEVVTADQAKATIARHAETLHQQNLKFFAIGREDRDSGMVELVIIPYPRELTQAQADQLNAKVGELMAVGFKMVTGGDAVSFGNLSASPIEVNSLNFGDPP